MKLYLVQHGLAKSKDEDPERPLLKPPPWPLQLNAPPCARVLYAGQVHSSVPLNPRIR